MTLFSSKVLYVLPVERAPGKPLFRPVKFSAYFVLKSTLSVTEVWLL